MWLDGKDILDGGNAESERTTVEIINPFYAWEDAPNTVSSSNGSSCRRPIGRNRSARGMVCFFFGTCDAR
jgi:hypothetical protein